MDWDNVLRKVPVQRVEQAQARAKTRLRGLQARKTLDGTQRQEVVMGRLHLTPVLCPACRFPLNVFVARAAYAELYEGLPEAQRKDEHHACPRCGMRVAYQVPLVGPSYAWELNLTDEQLQALMALAGNTP